LLENKIFTEKLDKLKKDRESTATQQIHLQNAMSGKIIEQLEVRLRN